MNKGKPKWRKLSEIIESLSGKHRKQGITDKLAKAESFGYMDSSLAFALTGFVMAVPEKSFRAYTKLIEKACAEGCIYGYNAEVFYSKLIGLIEESDKRIKFLKSVLRTVDEQVCGSDIALPHDHPYLQDESSDS